MKSAAERRAAEPGSAPAKMVHLAQLKGIGVVGAQELVNEVFYRDFDNRRQVGSYFGMTGTPFDSGESRREQGISKAGNHRARELAVELTWLWLRHQPGSEITRWFAARVGDTKGRMRRITIVAAATLILHARVKARPRRDGTHLQNGRGTTLGWERSRVGPGIRRPSWLAADQWLGCSTAPVGTTPVCR